MKKKNPCKHPGNRLFVWYARDDSIQRRKPGKGGVKSGEIMCIACCECGTVLEGGVDLGAEQTGEREVIASEPE